MTHKTALMTATILATMVTTSAIAFADDVNTPGGTYQSTASITFATNTDSTSPVDPLNPDPENPVTPTYPDGETPQAGTSGPLSIDFASSLKFGEQKISNKTQNYFANLQEITDSKGTTTKVPNYVQVTDETGSDQGWTLKVKQNTQLTDTKNNELTGAQITLNNGQIVQMLNAEATAPTATNQIDLQPKTEAIVASAEANEGQGTWITRYGDENNGHESISLKVPGSSIKHADKYQATLTWTLAQVPSAF